MKKNKKLSQLNDAPLTQPQNRTERFLAKIARLADTAPADTRNRLERYLAAIVQSTAQAGIISADTETTVEGILFGNSTTGKVEGIVPEMSAENVADYLEAVEEAVTAGGLVNSSQLNKWLSNPNLLDNWYFVGGGSQQGGGQFPINQRGQTSYSGQAYGIDRWKNTETTTNVTISQNYITVSSGNALGSIRQIIENFDMSKRYTISMLTDTGLYTATGTPNETANVVVYILGSPFYLNYSGNLIFDVKPNSSYNIIAIKLELGDTQTLAHQENGVWVLNEIPNYQEQLARCQRYYVDGASGMVSVGVNSWYQCVLSLPTVMAGNATVTGNFTCINAGGPDSPVTFGDTLGVFPDGRLFLNSPSITITTGMILTARGISCEL